MSSFPASRSEGNEKGWLKNESKYLTASIYHMATQLFDWKTARPNAPSHALDTTLIILCFLLSDLHFRIYPFFHLPLSLRGVLALQR